MQSGTDWTTGCGEEVNSIGSGKSFSVSPFDADVFAIFLANQVKRPFAEVNAKRQVRYLTGYLKLLVEQRPGFQNKCTMVTEMMHEDRDSLLNYAQFDVFTSSDLYSRRVKRIHFFYGLFLEEQLYNIFKGFKDANPSGVDDLQSHYIGCIVIRPNQEAFLGKTLLPCLAIFLNHLRLPFLRDYAVGLFGISLKVKKTVAWQEQDRVVSACASASLWFSYHAYNYDTDNPRFPVPASITRSATRDRKRTSAVFPNQGLTIPEIAQSIRTQGLEPYHFPFTFRRSHEPYDFSQMIRMLFAYAQPGVSVPILVLRNYRPLPDEKTRNIKHPIGEGDLEVIRFAKAKRDKEVSVLHTVTVLGYSERDDSVCETKGLGRDCPGQVRSEGHDPVLRSTSDDISYIIVHDDQKGMFIQLERADCDPYIIEQGPSYDDKAPDAAHYLGPFSSTLVPSLEPWNKSGKNNVDPSVNGVCQPDGIILGLHPKVRTHFTTIETEIKNFEFALAYLMDKWFWAGADDVNKTPAIREDLVNRAKDIEDSFWPGIQDSKDYKRVTVGEYPHFKWKIRLNRSHSLRKKLREQFTKGEEFTPKNSVSEDMLLGHWPLFVWRATAMWDNMPMLDLFFDATDPRQCNFVFLVTIYRKEIDFFARKYLFDVKEGIGNIGVYQSDHNLNSHVLTRWIQQVCGNNAEITGVQENDVTEDFGNDVAPQIHDHEKGGDRGVELIKKRFVSPQAVWRKKDSKYQLESLVDFFNNVFNRIKQDQENHQDLARKSPLVCLWLVDRNGDLIIGLEERVATQGAITISAKKLGHPCLTSGGRARMAGELIFASPLDDPSEGKIKVIINNKSGRYSRSATLRHEEHLMNVAKWLNLIAEKESPSYFFEAKFDKTRSGKETINSCYDLEKYFRDVLGGKLTGEDFVAAGREIGRQLFYSWFGHVHADSSTKQPPPSLLDLLEIPKKMIEEHPGGEVELDLSRSRQLAASALADFLERGGSPLGGVSDGVMEVLADWANAKESDELRISVLDALLSFNIKKDGFRAEADRPITSVLSGIPIASLVGPVREKALAWQKRTLKVVE